MNYSMRLSLLCLILLSAGCASESNVNQILLMLGSKAHDYDSINVMDKLSEERGIGIWGNDYGGEVSLFVDGKKIGSIDSGGHVHLLSSEVKTIELKGEVAVDLYVCAVLQIFEKWPDVYDGVLLEKRKIDAGIIDLTLDLESTIKDGFKILSEDKKR